MGWTNLNASPRVLLLLTAILWSSGGVLIKGVDLHPLAIAGLRSFFAFLFLIMVFGPGKGVKKDWTFWGAVFAYAGTVICFTVATKWTTAANAILLQSTAPLYVAVLSIFYLNEKPNRTDLISLVGVLIGLVFFFQGDIEVENMRGNVMGLIAGAFFGFFIAFTRKGGKSLALSSVVWGNLLAALAAIPTFLPTGEPLPDQVDFPIRSIYPTLGELGRLCATGVLQLGVPYLFYSRAIGLIPALQANLILLLEPILNPIWVFLFLGEAPSGWALFGGAIVLLSVTGKTLLETLPSSRRVKPIS